MRKILGSLLLFCCGVPAWSQDVSLHEVSVGVQSTTGTPFGGISLNGVNPYASDGYRRGIFLSPELRYTFNLNRNVALEAETSTSVDAETLNVREGGYQTLVLGGVKAGFRRGRWEFFGTSAAGAASFSCGEQVYNNSGGFDCTRITHFALRQGAAIEYAPSKRNFLRFDFAELLDTQFRKVYFSSPYIIAESWSGVPYHFLASVSVGHRFGRLQALDSPPDARKTHGYSVGGLYAVGIGEHLLWPELRADGGGGAWVGVPVWKFVSADIVAYDQPHDDHTATAQDGGTQFSAFAGPKIGFRKGPVGFYAKGRPGIVRFSRTFDWEHSSRLFGNSLGLHPKIDFALDTGLVLEYASPARGFRHIVTRFEGGSTYTHYGATSEVVSFPVLSGKSQTLFSDIPVAPQRKSSLVFLMGFGYAF